MATATCTEKALRGMAKREWLSTLRLMGICKEPRTKKKRAVIIRPDYGRVISENQAAVAALYNLL